jgi:hypothetical protein
MRRFDRCKKGSTRASVATDVHRSRPMHRPVTDGPLNLADASAKMPSYIGQALLCIGHPSDATSAMTDAHRPF